MHNRQSISSNHQSSGKPLLRGFTIIELLVVVAIISLLVSILLPSLNKAKDLARGVVCLSNLRCVGLATMGYAGENNNVIFLDHVAAKVWSTVLFNENYLEDLDITLCPSQPPNKFVNGLRTYGIRFKDAPDGCLIESTGKHGRSLRYLRLFSVKRVSDYVTYVDSLFVGLDAPTYTGDQFAKIVLDEAGHLGDIGAIHLRHRDGTNVWFLDGHSEQCGETRLKTACLAELPSDTPISVADFNGEIIFLNP